MLEHEPTIYDPSSSAGNREGSSNRRMEISDVNALVELTHQPYMYRKQKELFERRYSNVSGGLCDEDGEAATQEAIAVLRLALQILWALSLGEEKAVAFAEEVGNVPAKDLYRGESTLTFFEDTSSSSTLKSETGCGLYYFFRVSGDYKMTMWSNLMRQDASNTYFPYGCMADGCFIDDDGNRIDDAIEHNGPCYFLVSINVLKTGSNKDASKNWIRCCALAALVDYLGTLHLTEVELRVSEGKIRHQTTTLIAQAWRVAFEALTEMTSRNDKYGKRKNKFKVYCCVDCKTPRVIKRGKNAVRCPLCSNNNTKGDKSRKRHVY